MAGPKKTGFIYFLFRFLPLVIAFAGLGMSIYVLLQKPLAKGGHENAGAANGGVGEIKVLAYSGFMASWGPGPKLAELFEARFGIKVQFQDAGDAGLLLKKLELFPADVVIGIDSLNLQAARTAAKWLELGKEVPESVGLREIDFVPFDWAPMTFVYRDGDIEPPQTLNDLLAERFAGAISLEDPRTSTPGLQFFFWVLDELGVEEGIQFLQKLKPHVHSVSSSWSQAYGAFTKKQSRLVYSYSTSPIYHQLQEKDLSYRAAIFKEGMPAQVEYAAVPANCHECDGARKFALFLLEPEAQKLIMEKNVMLPVVPGLAAGTPFESIVKNPDLKVRQWKRLPQLLEQRDALFDRWRQLEM